MISFGRARAAQPDRPFLHHCFDQQAMDARSLANVFAQTLSPAPVRTLMGSTGKENDAGRGDLRLLSSFGPRFHISLHMAPCFYAILTRLMN